MLHSATTWLCRAIWSSTRWLTSSEREALKKATPPLHLSLQWQLLPLWWCHHHRWCQWRCLRLEIWKLGRRPPPRQWPRRQARRHWALLTGGRRGQGRRPGWFNRRREPFFVAETQVHNWLLLSTDNSYLCVISTVSALYLTLPLIAPRCYIHPRWCLFSKWGNFHCDSKELLTVEARGNVMFGYNGYLLWLRQR